MKYAVKQVSDYVVRGRGVVFGGKDLTGDRFTAKTDFGDTRSFVGMPVYYDHGLSDLQSQIGTVKMWQPDDEGIDVDIEIDKRHKYAQQVMALVKKGVLGLSTGALSHLVVRDGGELKRWIVGEISLTPTPAEPRTMAISDMKAVPQASNGGSANVSSNTLVNTSKELSTMSDQVIKDAVKATIEEMAGEPVRGGGVVAGNAPATKKLTTMGNSNDQMDALKHWMRTGDEIAAKAVLVEGTNANGGYLVPQDYAKQITDRRDETWIGAKLPMQRYTTSGQIFNIANQDEKSDFAFVSESGSFNEDEPTFAGSAITVYTASLGMKISNQLLRDQAMDLEGFIAREVGRAYARHLNQYQLVGTGSSQPYGILARATVSETLASVSGVDAGDILNIVHKLPEWYADDTSSVGWVMRNTTLGAIRALTGNFFSFQPTPMGDMNSLYTKPVAVSDKIAALGASAKAILFGNFNYYAFVENLGLEISRNPYLYQANYQTAIFCTVRWGGDVTQAEAFVYGVNPAS
ncbi:major_cap_HK97, phage major capsid protein, HK97 family [uncultured Caudovirales phage]|uniref:COG4653 Predicted phage phi-C31 gp36 major capsid-like protein n=1 Tax=uncultured Caudovirales phage TaxID=2100421 RepID=A0A6J7WTQ4_9CAUD|nr:major_cap_HK97, phage major capsid protein, HK97 family [uncultured Caudovirales phage]CAB5218643.1 COG4653 Predicted phage phi-C31 gp36 major capsid-like protein [uncultured Caudovirales phage]